jgi:hypothetical protein
MLEPYDTLTGMSYERSLSVFAHTFTIGVFRITFLGSAPYPTYSDF